jgi:hypothetical protein
MEWASLLFAGISAALSAIQVWQASRNKEAAAKQFDETFNKAKGAPETHKAAEQLLTIAPPEVIKQLEGRAESCWTNYRTVLGGPYLPAEVDNATDAVKACVCRELVRIHDINGREIPERWRGQWEAYACAAAGVVRAYP